MRGREPGQRRVGDQLRLTAPGRDGGMIELIHALAAIVARLDRERHERRGGDSPQEQQRQIS